MRLCCYIASDLGDQLGGVERVLATVLAGLPDRFEVTVVAPSAKVAEWVAAARPGASWAVLPAVRSKLDLGGFLRHVSALRRTRADVIHVAHNQLWNGQYGLLAARLLRVPAVSVIHYVQPPSYRFQPRLFAPLLRGAAVAAAVSAALAREVEAVLDMAAGSLRVAYNGVPEPAAGPAPAAPSGADRQPGAARFTVGAVGRMSPEKGFDGLLHALAELPDTELLLVGDGPQRGELTELAQRLGVAGRIRWAGWFDGTWTDRWSVDVLAVPSTIESFGLAAAEAMLAGIPVVATAVGGLPEVVEDGVTGLVVAPRDPPALAGALRHLQADPRLRARMGEAAAARARARFSVQAMLDRYVAMFDEAAATRVRRSARSPGADHGAQPHPGEA